MVQLRKLGLTAVATDAVLRQAKSLKELRELSVSLSEVDDAGFKDIAEMMNLEFLAADGTKITDACLKRDTGLTHLTYLSSADTAVTDEGIQKLIRHERADGWSSCQVGILWTTQKRGFSVSYPSAK